MQTISQKKLSWIFIEQPKADDISFIQKEFEPHPLIIGALAAPTYRPQFIKRKNYFFLVIHFPIFDENGRFSEIGEVDIMGNKKVVATICSHPHSPIASLFNQCHRNFEGCEKYFKKGPYYFLLVVVAYLLDHYFPILDKICREIDDVEAKLFKEKERKILRDISFLQRDLIDVRRVIKPQLGIFKAIASEKEVKSDSTLDLYVQNIISKNIGIWNNLENHLETVGSLYETSNIMLSYKTNRAMKTLTVFSVILLPATLIASTFGMNISLPLKNFWHAASLIAIVTISTTILIFLILRNSRK